MGALAARVFERQRWLIVILLFFLSVVNYLDRQALSVLAPTLREQFGFTAEQYSYVVTSFLVAYTIGFGAGGRILDKTGVKIALAVAVAFWSVTGMLHALATSWKDLALFRFLLGLGEGFNSPGGAKAVGEWIPKPERAFSMAIFSTGNIAGSILAPPLVTFLALRFSWQLSFVVTGALGFVWLGVWLCFYQSPEKHRFLTDSERRHILANREVAKSDKQSGGMALLRNPYCYSLIWARFLTDPVPYFFSFWLPEYLRRSRDYSMVSIGLLAWIPYLAADLGGLSGGAVSDWLIRGGLTPRQARMRVLLFAACFTPVAALAVRTGSGVVSLACISMVLGAHSCWIVNLLTSMTESFPRAQVGTVLGLSGMGGSIGGIIATLLTGHVVSRYGYVPVFTVLACLHPTAYLFLRSVLKRSEVRQ